jgi:hypothetical protein
VILLVFWGKTSKIKVWNFIFPLKMHKNHENIDFLGFWTS